MDDLRTSGFELANISLSEEQCDHVVASLPPITAGRGGVRGLIEHPTVLQLLRHKRLGDYLWSVVGRELTAVKATLFDRTAELSWRVQWHQDRVIAVREKMDVDGYGPWSTKLGVPHVEPPASVLEQMIALRIYLDDSRADNGPLRAIAGSHSFGKLSEQELQLHVGADEPVDIHVPKGGMLLMRPLLIHASVPSRPNDHRRVLHIEMAPPESISPLQWHTRVDLRRVV